MTPAETIATGLGIVTFIGGLISIIYYALAVRVYDVEQSRVTKEAFNAYQEKQKELQDIQTKHLDEKFGAQDRVLDKQSRMLEEIVLDVRASKQRRSISPMPGSGRGGE